MRQNVFLNFKKERNININSKIIAFIMFNKQCINIFVASRTNVVNYKLKFWFTIQRDKKVFIKNIIK